MPKSNDKKYIIKPVDVDESALNKIEEAWYYHPGLYVGIGSVAAGKSTVLSNLIEWWEPHFEDRIILFSPSIGNDPIIKKLIDEDKIFMSFDNYSNDTLDAVLQMIEQHDAMPGSKGKKWLICFDDMLGLIPKSNSREARYFNSYISRYRHHPIEGKVTLVMFTQYYKDLNPVIRTNTSIYMFLGSHSEKNKKQYSEELSTLFNGDESAFNNAWNTAKQKKYDILTLDIRNLKAYKNFDQLIYEREQTEDDKKNEAFNDLDIQNDPDTNE